MTNGFTVTKTVTQQTQQLKDKPPPVFQKAIVIDTKGLTVGTSAFRTQKRENFSTTSYVSCGS